MGDDGEYQKTKCYKNKEEGGVNIGPRNFFTGDLKKRGCLKAEEAVHDPGFITLATGNPYKVQPPPGLRMFPRDTYEKGGHEVNWKYAKQCTHKKATEGAAFNYIEEGVPKKKSKRDADGEVILEPVNFKIKPMPRGRT